MMKLSSNLRETVGTREGSFKVRDITTAFMLAEMIQ